MKIGPALEDRPLGALQQTHTKLYALYKQHCILFDLQLLVTFGSEVNTILSPLDVMVGVIRGGEGQRGIRSVIHPPVCALLHTHMY